MINFFVPGQERLLMTNKIQAAYILGQNAAMQKHARDRGGLTYNPTYSPADIRAIRRYNKDVASGQSNWAGAAGTVGLLGGVGAAAGADKYYRALAQGANPANALRSAGRSLKSLAGAHKGKLGLLAAGGFALGKGLGYMNRRIGQGFDNYLYTDLNAQDLD